MDIRAGQKLAWENKVAKGFNTTDVPLEFCPLQGEVAEAFDAWRKGRGTVGEELADVALFLLSLAEMTGVDLQHYYKGSESAFVETLDAIAVGSAAHMLLAPMMIYGDDVTRVITEEGIAYLCRAASLDERRDALAAVAVLPRRRTGGGSGAHPRGLPAWPVDERLHRGTPDSRVVGCLD